MSYRGRKDAVPRAGSIEDWLDAVVPVMNDPGYETLATAEPEPSTADGYKEETIIDQFSGAEIHGQDGFGWYVDADLAREVLRRLNYDTGGEGRAKAWDRGDRGKVVLAPHEKGSCFRRLVGARRSDFVTLGFVVMDEEPEYGPAP